jgi:Tol biopolymer transport system component
MGGSGQLMIVTNNELEAVNADGSSSRTIISKQQFEKEFAPIPTRTGTPQWYPTVSPDGQKLLVLTCTMIGFGCSNYKLYLSDVDFKRVKTFQSYKAGLTQWSPDGDKILVRETNGNTEGVDIISAGADFGKVTHLPIASSAYWSSDGKSVYYYNNGWFIVNNDGTGAHPLKCDLCSLASNPSNFVVAESPDDQRIAIGTIDGTVIIANTSDFNQFKLASVGSYVNQLHWSPDSQKLAVDINMSPNQSDVIILGMDGTVIEKLVRPEDANFIITCGWSPNSEQTDYQAILSTGYDLYLHTLGQQESFHLLSTEGYDQSCPVWLPASP